MASKADTSQINVIMKTATGEEVTVQLAENAGSDKGKSFLQLDTSKMLVDVGCNTADAVRQQDGSWEVDGQGSTELVSSMAVSAERKARKVGFLPRQVERKIARSTRLALVSDGQITISDGTVIRRANGQG
ncbi:hypothetical protein [Pseudomonas aeruginosa]|uniref:hypothetical protein n=1 Tax=Pseudomonas aeruginosa TaxID=287 RepID=UPI000EB5FCBB|nr:hypothetical protein [Pseudomonas aeruginosa]